MLVPLIPVIALTTILLAWSLIDIIRKPVQLLPKWAWVLFVLIFIPLGAIVYLIVGRSQGQKIRDEDLR
ncbi:phospholipase [Propioniciclava flava]|uniref:Phospholipase n=2 Tax=Propioniciclava flava TaxID=2072026 RepID=A0A4Q2EGW4_9ACTN|nr:phospholipase [Propioniciclava flava]